MLYLKAHDLVYLMRTNGHTIRSLSATMGLTQQRIQAVRATGLTCPHSARDWLEAITGADPGLLDQPWRR